MAYEIKKNSPGCRCCTEDGLDVYTTRGRATNGEGYVTHRKQTEGFVGSWKIDAQYHQIANLAVNDAGDMWIGMSRTAGAAYLIAKYNSSGTQQWTASGAVGTAATQYVTALKVDLDSNVYVTYFPTGFEKWDSAGSTQWNKLTSVLGANLCVDSSGDIIWSDGSTVDKFNAAGTSQWSKSINHSDVDIVADTNDDFYIQYFSALSKYDSSGTEITSGSWPVTYSGVASLAIGPSDDIYAGQDGEIKRFDSTGSLQTTLTDSRLSNIDGKPGFYVVDHNELYVPWNETIATVPYYLAKVRMDGTVDARDSLYGSTTAVTKMPGCYVPFVAT